MARVSAEQINWAINRYYPEGYVIGLTEIQFSGMSWVRTEDRARRFSATDLATFLNHPLNADVVRICLLVQALNGTHHVDFAVSEFQAPRRRFHFEKTSNSVL